MNDSMKTVAVLCTIGLLAGVGLAIGLTSLSFHQSPIVPATINFATSPTITEGSDQSALWIWDSATHRFSATIQITNNGNGAFTPTIVFGTMPTGWVGTTSTLTAIPAGQTASVTLYATTSSINTSPGAIGNFVVTIS